MPPSSGSSESDVEEVPPQKEDEDEEQSNDESDSTKKSDASQELRAPEDHLAESIQTSENIAEVAVDLVFMGFEAAFVILAIALIVFIAVTGNTELVSGIGIFFGISGGFEFMRRFIKMIDKYIVES